ncbi:hypothetical protein P3102_21675 [Amycolatopsis sp. QT-25]|uniref:hypothetical protein n=1 Tax=Amycolatopsis sp. QT-25 TaxID=3034022 RepID=UPI0023ECAA59|nr:hypothetical protein [Amycolatopsis sp. QT-25]WET76720.1 hypothetical protein P3102_21675 [Amycolatopsis sp. QT-25]
MRFRPSPPLAWPWSPRRAVHGAGGTGVLPGDDAAQRRAMRWAARRRLTLIGLLVVSLLGVAVLTLAVDWDSLTWFGGVYSQVFEVAAVLWWLVIALTVRERIRRRREPCSPIEYTHGLPVPAELYEDLWSYSYEVHRLAEEMARPAELMRYRREWRRYVRAQYDLYGQAYFAAGRKARACWSGGDAEGWRAHVATMIELAGNLSGLLLADD